MRIALGISYQGSAYHGWQTQTGLQTIQSVLEEAIAKVADHPIVVICAGRTDKGVHALGQVAHFESIAVRRDFAWLLGINSHLPEDIRIDWVQEVPDTFHARFSAIARRYRYIIDNRLRPSALWNKHTSHYYHPLNETWMQTAANYLVGEHDFSSFRAMSCQAKNAIRHIHQLEVSRQADNVMIEITANAFLHHMVRNIAGVLLQIGFGKQDPEWAKAVLLAKDRRKAAVTAKPNGLYLTNVFYPESFFIPSCSKGFFSL